MPKQIKPKVTYYLDKKNKNNSGAVPIKANISINYKNITKIIDHALASNWNPKQQRVRPPKQDAKDNNYKAINKKLDQLQKDFETFVDNCMSNRIEVTPQIAKQFLQGKRSVTEKQFWPAYEEYIKMLRVEPKTKQNYTLYKTKLKEFEDETGYYIDYHTINSAFFEKYKYYILTTKELGWNTFATAIKKLKFFMNWGLKMKYHDTQEYKTISATEKEPTVIFLTMDELKTLYHYDFGNKRLNQVRDKFCFGCFTSLAYSDLDKLTREHINDGRLTKFRQKSKKLHDVELPEQAIKIIERYQDSYKALPKISNQRFNDYIRECCKIAGINTPTIYKTFPKGIETENIAPKHELVSSHTARKTFITNFYDQTKDMNLTKKNAAITQDKTLRRYMGSNKEMEKNAMKKAFGDL